MNYFLAEMGFMVHWSGGDRMTQINLVVFVFVA